MNRGNEENFLWRNGRSGADRKTRRSWLQKVEADLGRIVVMNWRGLIGRRSKRSRIAEEA